MELFRAYAWNWAVPQGWYNWSYGTDNQPESEWPTQRWEQAVQAVSAIPGATAAQRESYLGSARWLNEQVMATEGMYGAALWIPDPTKAPAGFVTLEFYSSGDTPPDKDDWIRQARQDGVRRQSEGFETVDSFVKDWSTPGAYCVNLVEDRVQLDTGHLWLEQTYITGSPIGLNWFKINGRTPYVKQRRARRKEMRRIGIDHLDLGKRFANETGRMVSDLEVRAGVAI